MSIKNIPQSLLDAVMKVLTEAHEEHPMIEVDGVMKHRLNSLGQPIHSTDEGIRNFHRWFGDSQVVDEHGRPQVVYHGTMNSFDSFKEGDIGFHFGNKSQAVSRVGRSKKAKIIPVYLNIKNLLHIDEDYGSWDADYSYKKSHDLGLITNDELNSGLKHHDSWKGYRSNDAENFRKTIESKGYSGIKYLNRHEGSGSSHSYIAFRPHQIKSVDNSGDFSHPTKITESIEHPMIEVDGVMKHRHNSLGQPIHPTDEGIKNFHRWFGDSKAVDEQGRPKVFYHGTGADFSEFKTSGGHGKTFGTGTFFSDNPQIASTYAVDNMRNVIPVYLNIASPVIVDANDKNWNSIQQKSSVQIPLKSGKSKSTTVKSLFKGEFDYPDDTISTDDIARWTRLNGHHGLLIKNVIDHGPTRYGEEPRSPSTLIVAFHPHQIKSALGNSGAFSHPTKITEAIDAKHHNISMTQSTGADKSKWVNFSLKDDSGKQIGSLMLSSHDAGKNYSVREANVDAAHRGLGHGKDMYLAAINFAKENNANLTSDKSISVDANKVWNSIRKMDIDVTRHPNVKFVADKLRTHRNIDIDGKSVSIPSDEPVWKYTNNQSMITESEEDYRGSHTAPVPDYGAPAHDLTRGIYPEDFYSSKGSRLYGDGRDDDYKVHSQLRTLRNRPEAEVTIYRAVPNDSKITEINPGDWVTTNLQYAHDHGERFDSHKILSKRVKAKEIFTDGNSFHEFGYHPETSIHESVHEIRVVPADDSDYPKVAEIDKQFPNNVYSEYQFRKPGYSLAVAKDSTNRIHGYILTKLGEDSSTLIVKMLTDKDSRKSGIGSNLLDHVINRDGKVSLNVRHHNDDAISLYKSKGFELHHVNPSYYMNGDDAFHMRNF